MVIEGHSFIRLFGSPLVDAKDTSYSSWGPHKKTTYQTTDKKGKAYNKEEINIQTTDERKEKAYNKEEINTKTTDDKNRKKKDK